VIELARNLKVESVSRLHPTAPHCLPTHATVEQAVVLMRQRKVGCLLVTEGERLVGVFTERDLLRRVLAAGQPLSLPLGSVFTPNPVTVRPDDPIGVAVGRMEEGGHRHLPVVDATGRPTGVLSVKRIVHYLVEHFPSAIYNLPPDPGTFPRESEGA